MTGKEMMLYILQNDLMDKDIFAHDVLMTEIEAAAKFEVGVGTIRTWFVLRKIGGICIGDSLFIFRGATDPRKEVV